MEANDDDVVLLENEEDMNLVITSVVSLANDSNANENCVTSDQSAYDNHSQTLSKSENATRSSTSVCSPLSGTTVIAKGSTSLPTFSTPESVLPTVITELPVEPIPNIEKCLVSWKNIFPWVVYEHYSNTFICSICMWGYNLPKHHVVYKLVSAKNIICVARRLRYHAEKTHHKIVVNEVETVQKLFKGIYPMMKNSHFKIANLKDIENRVLDILKDSEEEVREESKSNLPSVFAINKLEKKSLVPVLIKTFVAAIENQLLESLRRSPYFSVISIGRIDFHIVRWLNQDSEVVEHYFYNSTMPGLVYLQHHGVQMTRMVSYSDLTVSPPPNVAFSKVVNIADRPCPIEVLIKYLRLADSLALLFLHVDVLPRICSIAETTHQLPIVQEIAKIEDSKAYMCLLSKEIINFMLSNFSALDYLVSKSDIKNKGALNFKRLSANRSLCETFCIMALPLLNDIILEYDSEGSTMKLRNLVSSLSTEIKECKTKVTSIIQLFISNMILYRNSQKSEHMNIIDIMVKDTDSISFSEFASVCQTLAPELRHIGLEQIFELKAVLGNDSKSSPLRLLGELQCCPQYHARFSSLLSLGQKIMMLPVLNAHVERYLFELAATGLCIHERLTGYLVPYIEYISLEGPDNAELIDQESIIKAWLKTAL